MKLATSFLFLSPLIPGLTQLGQALAIDKRALDTRQSDEAPFPSLPATEPRKIIVVTDEGMFQPNLAIHRDGQSYFAAHTWILFEGVTGNPPIRVELGRSDGHIHVAKHKGDLSTVDLADRPHPDPGVKRSITVLETRTQLSNQQIWNPMRAWRKDAGPPSWVEYIWRDKAGLNGETPPSRSMREKESMSYPYMNTQFRTSPEFAMTLLANMDVKSQGALFPGGPLENGDVRALREQLRSNEEWELRREQQAVSSDPNAATNPIGRLVDHDSMDKIGGGRLPLTTVYHFDMSDASVPNEQKRLSCAACLNYAGRYPPGGS